MARTIRARWWLSKINRADRRRQRHDISDGSDGIKSGARFGDVTWLSKTLLDNHMRSAPHLSRQTVPLRSRIIILHTSVPQFRVSLSRSKIWHTVSSIKRIRSNIFFRASMICDNRLLARERVGGHVHAVVRVHTHNPAGRAAAAELARLRAEGVRGELGFVAEALPSARKALRRLRRRAVEAIVLVHVADGP